jgi:hypothetical protein
MHFWVDQNRLWYRGDSIDLRRASRRRRRLRRRRRYVAPRSS